MPKEPPMQPTDLLYINLLKNTDAKEAASCVLTPEEQQTISALALRHYTSPLLLPYINEPQLHEQLKQQTKQMILNYHQIAHFTFLVTSLLDDHQIPYILLKGISLAACYPQPEFRKLGDVDIYISDPDALKRAKKLLESSGFVPETELSDHHLTYQYTFPKTGRSFILELHFRVVGLYQYEPANRLVDQVFSCASIQSSYQQIHNYNYRVLPPTENTFYMLHHMLKHYLYCGFGIRLLYDFTLYLNQNHTQIHFAQIHEWCQISHITHFYEIIITSCRSYLGLLPFVEKEIHYDEAACRRFLADIVHDRDMGTATSATLVGSGSYETINLLTCFKEGHLQMHVRFPRLGKCVLLWPVLWCITFFCFLKNTYCLRKTTLRHTLRTFRDNNQHVRQIHIFDNSDR